MITEGNVIIAEFMNFDIKDNIDNSVYRIPDSFRNISKFDYSSLCFNSSWDWLIPALTKFKGILSRKYPEQNEQLFHLWDLVMRTHKAFDLKYTFENFVYLLKWSNENLKDYNI